MATLPAALRRRPPRWAIVVAGILALYSIFGFLILPRIVRAQMEKKLPDVLHRPVTVREVRFNPFAISMTIRGFSVRQPDGSPLLSFEELYVDVALLRHWRGGVHLESVKLVRPEVAVAIEKGGQLNFADLLAAPEPAEPVPTARLARKARAEPPKPEPDPTVFEIAHFLLDRGAIAFADRNRPHPFQARLEPLSFALDGFTTEPKKNGAYHFEARLEPATQLAWTGSISVTPPKSEGELSITGIPLAQFENYAEDSTTFRITAGTLDVRGKYVFDASSTPSIIRLEEGSARLNGLRLDPPGRDEALVRIDSLAFDGVSADVGQAQARIRSIALSGARIVARRLEDGAIELATLTPPRRRAPSSSSPSSEPSRPWSTRLDQLRVERLDLLWEDHTTPAPASVEIGEFALSLAPLAVPGDTPASFSTSMRIGGEGHFSAKGTLHPGSGSVEAEFALSKLALAMFQPYAALAITGSIGRGELDMTGRASFAPASGGAGRVRLGGDLSVSNFALLDSEGKELAGFERFALEKLATDTQAVSLGRVLLKGARMHYRINPDGSGNWASLSRQPARPEAGREDAPIESKRQGPEPRISIGAIALQNLSFDFTDRSLQPPFTARITRFGGQIAPFKKPGMVKSQIDFAGKLDGASLRVAGTLRPAGKDSDADIAVTLAPWNLPPTTPYGIRYTGYPVQRGKLTLDLKYKLGGRRVEASNVVAIHQLQLGDKVDSPTATGLPVKLALAILTDREGKLEIDLPIDGELDDPDFRVGKLVVHAILNVLQKAATSPFALLGSLFGHSEDLSMVEFAAGSDELGDAGRKKLESLAKALAERPGLRLSIAGGMDPEADRKGLLQSQLQETLLARRRGPASGKPAHGDDEPLSDAERGTALHALYLERVVAPREKEAAELRAEGKPVPAGFVARRDAPAPDVEAMLMQTMSLSPDALADLARSRAETVQDELTESYGIDPERVFVATTPETPRTRQATLQLE